MIFDSLAGFVDAWLSPPAPAHPAAPASLTTVVAAAESIDRRVLALDPDTFVALAEDLRRGGERAKLSWRWRDLTPRDAKRLLDEGRGRVGVASLVTFHRNGYVRQVGLEALARHETPQGLWAFALRLDDIVPALRERARAEIERRLLPENAAEVAALLPLVQRLSKRARAGASAAMRAIEGFLVDPARGRAALTAATRQGVPDVRLAASVLACRRAGLDDAAKIALLAACLDDDDRRIMRWAAIEISSARVSDAVKDRLLPEIDHHVEAAIRRRALLARVRWAPAGAEKHLEGALFDPRASVRHVAREKLKDGRSRQIYRVVLETEGIPRVIKIGALSGLAEVGLAEDTALVTKWLDEGDPRLQAEAVRCLGMLAPSEHRALFEARAASPYARVRREALRALARIEQTGTKA